MSTIIVGGGVAGLSAAARLAPLGPVTLLEAEDHLSYHASGRSAAVFLEHYGNTATRALNAASLPDLGALEGVLGPRSVLLVGRRDQAARFEANCRDGGLERIGFEDAHALCPILDPETCAHLAIGREIYDLDTDLILQHFRKTALAHGARIETRAQVDGISRVGSEWHVRAGQRDWRADTLVNAAGAWADMIAEMAGLPPVGLQPFRRSMARLPAPQGQDTRGWPLLDGVDDLWYAKPDAGALLVSPGDEDPMPPQDAWPDDMVLAEGLARFEEMVTMPVTRLLTSWAGLRTFAPDRTLVIGRDPLAPSFAWLAGQGGYGFQTCFAASAHLAATLGGPASVLDPAVSGALAPDRFR